MSICIITVVKNNPIDMLETYYSIKSNLHNIKLWIIVDGNNGTSITSIMEEEIRFYDNVKIIKGLDRGLYNAMNIGASYAGDEDYLWWINAGDKLYEIPEINFNYDLLFYKIIIKETSKISKLDVKNLDNGKNYFPVSIFWHQGFIVKKKIFAKYLYDESLKLAADLYLMSLCQKYEQYFVSDQIICTYSIGGISNKLPILWLKEYIKVANKLQINIFMMPLKCYLLIIKLIIKGVILSFK